VTYLREDRCWQALVGIALLAALVRFPTLDLQSFWHDEAVTVNRIIQPGLGDTLSAIPDNESTPPLYYLVAWFWTKLFGTGEVGLRSLSALCGVLCVPVVYAAAARLAGARIGLVAAALVAVNPLLVHYSQEARAYALLVLMCAVSFLFFVRARERGETRDLALFALSSALALATHYFAVFVVAPEVVLLLIARWEQGRAAALWAIAGVGAAGAALLPLALHQQDSANNNWFSDLALGPRLTDVPKAFLIGEPGAQVSRALALAALAVALAVVLLALRADARERRAALIALAVAAGAALIPLALAVLGSDFFIHRNLLGALVPLLVVVAVGFGASRAGWVGLAGAGAACTVALAMLVVIARDEELQRADWRSVAAELGPAPGGRAIVTAFLGDDPLEVYLPGTGKLPRRGARVREVAVIAYSRPTTRRPAPGFRLVERRRVERFTLLRFRSPTPRLVRPARLRARRLGAERNTVLFQPPAGGRAAAGSR